MRFCPVVFSLFLCLLPVAHAQDISCGSRSDLPALLECTESAVLALPEAKRVQLTRAVLNTARTIGGEALEETWRARLDGGKDVTSSPETVYPDYGWLTAREIIQQDGVKGLVDLARSKAGSLRYGRAEALLAAGKRAAGFEQDDGVARMLSGQVGLAAQINDELLALAPMADDFERGDLAQSAAYLATLRCDLGRFEAARRMALAPETVRYDFWRARITGDRTGLPGAIIAGANAKDTSHVRQALDGIVFLAKFGLCGG